MLISLIDIMILYAVKRSPGITGYGIHSFIKERFEMEISYGSLYPHLFHLAFCNAVSNDLDLKSKQRNNHFMITSNGEQFLDDQVNRLRVIMRNFDGELLV